MYYAIEYSSRAQLFLDIYLLYSILHNTFFKIFEKKILRYIYNQNVNYFIERTNFTFHVEIIYISIKNILRDFLKII